MWGGILRIHPEQNMFSLDWRDIGLLGTLTGGLLGTLTGGLWGTLTGGLWGTLTGRWDLHKYKFTMLKRTRVLASVDAATCVHWLRTTNITKLKVVINKTLSLNGSIPPEQNMFSSVLTNSQLRQSVVG